MTRPLVQGTFLRILERIATHSRPQRVRRVAGSSCTRRAMCTSWPESFTLITWRPFGIAIAPICRHVSSPGGPSNSISSYYLFAHWQRLELPLFSCLINFVRHYSRLVVLLLPASRTIISSKLLLPCLYQQQLCMPYASMQLLTICQRDMKSSQFAIWTWTFKINFQVYGIMGHAHWQTH